MRFFVALPLASVVCAASCALPPIDYDGEGFTDHEALELVAISVEPFEEATFNGTVRAATADDVSRFVNDGAGHAPIDVDESFVVEGAVLGDVAVPQPLLLSFHLLTADGGREVLFMPDAGDALFGSVKRSGWSGNLTANVLDEQGVVFAGSEMINEPLEGAAASVEPQPDPLARVDATTCGHRREKLLRVTLNGTSAEAANIRIGASASVGDLSFTNHATWAVESDWQCTDAVNPIVWSAVRR